MVTAMIDAEASHVRSAWVRFPSLYEIDTWIWLADLSQKIGRPIDLGSVPAAEWDALAEHGFDAVWLMGVWTRSPAGTAIANENAGLVSDFLKALPDFKEEDNVGSPYCVRDYAVDPHLGGPEGLAAARLELSRRGMKLILDFVPNHVAPDHAWARTHPEYFVRGGVEDVVSDPATFLSIDGNVFARGRDPNFPAWPDVLQLNLFHPGLRAAVIERVGSIAEQCDGVRCDMAMLPMTKIFERTWGLRPGPKPATEYWPEIISAVKAGSPGFLFIGEAYWDLEWELQQQGFDFCYDKKLYDRLEHSDAESVRLHLCANIAYQARLLRFIENHDEPRAATAFPGAKQRAAAVTVASLPGIRMFHEGEFEGRRVRPPVFLGRRPAEETDEGLREFYGKLLKAVNQPVFRSGAWSLCERSGWPDNSSFLNLVAWSWTFGEERRLIVVNLSDGTSQAHVKAPWAEVECGVWSLKDAINGDEYVRSGNELRSPGIYVELGPWKSHIFRCRPLPEASSS